MHGGTTVSSSSESAICSSRLLHRKNRRPAVFSICSCGSGPVDFILKQFYTTIMNLSAKTNKFLLKAQKNELTEHIIYENIAALVKDEKNHAILLQCAAEEQKHAGIWENITGKKCKPNKWKIFRYTLMARLLGYTFTLKLMEGGEKSASPAYRAISGEVPEAAAIAEDETKHEAALLDILDEERLQYVGSMVLGLSDALVELTGTLAGLTFALQNNRLVALSGLITGIAATLSMTSSAYLSEKADGKPHPVKSSLYTGGVYLLTVIVLILPYLLLPADAGLSAILILGAAVILLIAAFMFYVSVAKSESFFRKFGEMAAISISVAVLSFGIGLLVKHFLGIDI
jgi:VIT1/CCC1 family predicted Fe2+/Mn2+ transporter